MSLFRFNFDKPGPGIEKDTPPKKGIFRWWEIFTRDFGAMLLGNLCFFVCAMPALACAVMFYATCSMGQPSMLMLVLNLVAAVLLGPALAALHRLTLQMCRDEPFFTWHEFKKAFRQDFKQGAIAMVILAFLADLIMLNFYLLTVMEGYPPFVVVMLFLSVYIWFSLMNTVFQQIALMELPLHTIFKNAVLMVLVSGWRGVLTVVIDIVVVLLLMTYSYAAAPLVVFGFFAWLVMTTDLIFWPRFRQLFIDRDAQPVHRRSAAQEWREVAEQEEHRQADAAGTDTVDEQWARTLQQDGAQPPEASDTDAQPKE